MEIEALASPGRLEITHAVRDLCGRWCSAAVAIWTEDINNRAEKPAVMLISLIFLSVEGFRESASPSRTRAS
jgi:hypothetical protein